MERGTGGCYGPAPLPTIHAIQATALAAALSLSACGASQASYDGTTYRSAEASFSLGSLGAGWERIYVEDSADLAMHHEGHGAIVQVNVSCDPALDIPLVALTNHLLVGFRNREDVEPQEYVSMDGREALRTHMRATLDGVPRQLLFYVLGKDGCVYDFALIGVPGSGFEPAKADYERMIEGFHAGDRAE